MRSLLAPVPDSEGIPALMDNDLASADGKRSVLLLLQVMLSQKDSVSSATAAKPQERQNLSETQVLSKGK